jgi:hypothetical protein
MALVMRAAAADVAAASTRRDEKAGVPSGVGNGALASALERVDPLFYLAAPCAVRSGALTHDDRIDAVAGAVAHFQRAMMMDVDQVAKAMRDEEMLAEIEDFLEGFNQPTYPRHADQWGSGRCVVLRPRVVRG